MSNFVFVDQEYQRLGDDYRTLYSDLANDHNRYMTALNSLIASGVTSGHVCENLKTFQGAVRPLERSFETKAHTTSSTFIAEIRAADKFG